MPSKTSADHKGEPKRRRASWLRRRRRKRRRVGVVGIPRH